MDSDTGQKMFHLNCQDFFGRCQINHCDLFKFYNKILPEKYLQIETKHIRAGKHYTNVSIVLLYANYNLINHTSKQNTEIKRLKMFLSLDNPYQCYRR